MTLKEAAALAMLRLHEAEARRAEAAARDALSDEIEAPPLASGGTGGCPECARLRTRVAELEEATQELRDDNAYLIRRLHAARGGSK